MRETKEKRWELTEEDSRRSQLGNVRSKGLSDHLETAGELQVLPGKNSLLP